jgi:hypothetical protein
VDEAPYRTALLNAYGETVVPPRTGKPGRPRRAYQVPPPDLHYATVHKTRRKGRVVQIELRVVFGEAAAVQAALERSAVSHTINTAFVERHNGTDWNRNAQDRRVTVSPRTGTSIMPRPTSPCTPTTSAGPSGPCVSGTARAAGTGEPRR